MSIVLYLHHGSSVLPAKDANFHQLSLNLGASVAEADWQNDKTALRPPSREQNTNWNQSHGGISRSGVSCNHLEHFSSALAVTGSDQRCVNIQEAMLLEEIVRCEGQGVANSSNGSNGVCPAQRHQ